MKTQILCAVAVLGLVTGCAEMRKHMGGAKEGDQNVMSGGPVTGTTLKDLPQAVRSTLKDRVPSGEVADIDKETWNGRVVYKISFSEPGKNPTMFIAEDGSVVQKSDQSSGSTTTQPDTTHQYPGSSSANPNAPK